MVATAATASPYAQPQIEQKRIVLPRRKTPVTNILIGLNVAVYVAMVLRGVNPVEPTTQQLLPWGANWGPLSLSTEPWRILASNYLHGGIVHIALNMWCLWNLGALSELIFDAWTYVLIYTASGIGGSLASLWIHPVTVGVGASGAIFGLAGALIAALYLGHLPIPKSAVRGTLKSLVLFAVYNLFFGAAVGVIDNSAHIGGLVAGLLMGAAMAKHLMTSEEVRTTWRRLLAIAAIVVLSAGFFLVRRANGYVIQLQQGMNAFQQKRYDDAIRALEPVYAKKPNDRLTVVMLASAYIEKKDFDKVIPMLQHEVELDPKDAPSQFNLGLALVKVGRVNEAIPHLQKAVELNPKDDEAQQVLQQAEKLKDVGTSD
jgi:rhomboid protease GluP